MEDKHLHIRSGQTMLQQALDSAELLLNYATEHGLDIKKEWVATVIQAKRFEENQQWTLDEEIEFWMVYKELSKLVQPVSVQSLKATMRKPVHNQGKITRFFRINSKPSLSMRSVRNYLFWTLFFILSVVIVQVITLKGTTTLNNMQNNYKRMDEVNRRMDELRLLMDLDEDNERAVLEYYRLESEKGKIDREISGSIQLLIPWVDFLRSVTGRHSREKEADLKKQLSQSDKLIGTPGNNSPPSKADNMISDNVSIIQEAQNFTQILQLYVLPLLYGLIGGFIFVLRGLASDIRNQVFSQYSNIKYSLRIHLGALAGLIVGLLWGDIEKQQITFLESLSTAGLAFIAGYGVEYLFEGIDKFIGSIGGDKNNQKTKPCT